MTITSYDALRDAAMNDNLDKIQALCTKLDLDTREVNQIMGEAWLSGHIDSANKILKILVANEDEEGMDFIVYCFRHPETGKDMSISWDTETCSGKLVGDVPRVTAGPFSIGD